MKIRKFRTGKADKAVLEIAKTVKEFSSDIGSLAKLPLNVYYEFVKGMPYRRDPIGREVISRPKYILKYSPALGRDCKKQSTLIASWAEQNGVPYKFCVVSNRLDKKPHHIFCQLFVGGKWIDADATYNRFKLGERRPTTYRKNYEVI